MILLLLAYNFCKYRRFAQSDPRWDGTTFYEWRTLGTEKPRYYPSQVPLKHSCITKRGPICSQTLRREFPGLQGYVCSNWLRSLL